MESVDKIANSLATSRSPRYDFIFLYNEPFTVKSLDISLEPPIQIVVLCVLPMILYLLCLYVIFPALRPTSKSAILDCDKWRKRHNIFMCLYSLATFLLTLRELLFVSPDEGRFLFSSNVEKDWTPMMCNKPSTLMYWVNAVFIVSKIVEWIDTAFIIWLKNDDARAILRENKHKNTFVDHQTLKKPVGEGGEAAATTTDDVADAPATKTSSQQPRELSFLHAYHHMTTLFAFLLVLNCHGAVKCGPLLNGFVHFLMYWHYASPLPKSIVPFITFAQILQFFFVIYLWYAAAEHCGDFKSLVEAHPWEWRTPFLFTPVYLVFFVKYFVQRFILGGRKQKRV